jgi:PUB domain/VHL beta domain
MNLGIVSTDALWRGESVVFQWLCFFVITALLAFGVNRVMSAIVARNSPADDVSFARTFPDEANDVKVDRIRNSRLLRKQFGVLEDELSLRVEVPVSEQERPGSNRSIDQPTLEHSNSSSNMNNALTCDASEPACERTIDAKSSDPIDSDLPIDSSYNSNSLTKSEQHSPGRSGKLTQLQRIQQYNRQRFAAAAENRQQLLAHNHHPPSFSRRNDEHPGLAAFWNWCDVESSLFRIFTVTRKDGVQDETTTAPYNPSSRRGHVPIQLLVTNDMDVPITVYWIDFKGAHVPKGRIVPNGGTWRQTTWIDHPWIFCTASSESNDEVTLLHYIPYRVIPTTLETPTVDADDTTTDSSGVIGTHRFHILNAPSDSVSSCMVRDPVLPHPASMQLASPRKAAEFALLHCVRMNYLGWAVLLKYIENIVKHPDQPQLRQIRLANPTFSEYVWNTPAKGVLLAMGFIENDAYVEFGSEVTLSSDTIQEFSILLHMIQMWKSKAEDSEHSVLQQPEGADGYGRAGWGR